MRFSGFLRSAAGIIVIITFAVLGVVAAIAYSERQKADEVFDPTGTVNGFSEELATEHGWVLPAISYVGTKSLAPGVTSHDIVITDMYGQVPFDNESIPVKVGNEYALDLTLEQDAELNETGSICIHSGTLVQLPTTDMSDLEQRMNDCNDTIVVVMTVYISEVM